MSKLLYITTNLQGSGGVARVLSVKLNYLIETYGYTIHVITTNNKSDTFFYDFNSKIVFHRIEIKNFGFVHLLKYKKSLQEIVDVIKPNIIVNCDNGFKGTLLPYLLNTSAALIYERHGSRQIKTMTLIESLKKNFANLILDRSLYKYKAFIVLNEEDAKDWKADNVVVMSNPLWLSVPKIQNTLQNKVAVAIGRHSIEKQFDVLVQIWKNVIVQYPDWKLKIYGETVGDRSIEKLVQELHMENHIELHAPIKNINQVYSNASLLLNTSSSEAFGLVIIEAMAFGLPVIAFDGATGPKTVIENEKNGMLIKNNDTQAYANKIKELINNDTLRKTIGENAKVSVSRFDLERIMQHWHELYQSLN
ncbi:glycosyltransferase [Mariniflexile aquimaris]|uniref:Glycosyltransferase n=1 Tax=Mariniflexile aquimaris TaxID=881009 RepID=A0ABW3BWM2_9FLAO